MQRIAGGWVRDKLLGLDSEDLDIVLDTVKGEAFALHLQEFAHTQGLEVGHVATISVNPEKSKHLETATAHILGKSIDFVHLRTETYNEDSRNPLVGFGTPLEDALRRDITINALFYNIQSEQVEDFTDKGLADLKSGIIRTPMPALQTFIDDPLRVLRVIRFATRFNYQLDQDILNAVQNKDIQDSFSKKITRERIGVEVDKMITGPDPVRALQLIKDFGFYSLVFEPLDPLPAPINQDLCLHVMEMIHASRKLDVLGIGSFTKEQLRFLSLASTVVPVLGYTCKIKSKMCPAERGIILHSLKLSNRDADVVCNLVEHAPLVKATSLAHHQSLSSSGGLSRKELGRFVRELAKQALNDDWKLAIYFALIWELVQTGITVDQLRDVSHSGAQTILSRYTELLKAIDHHDLNTAHQYKTLIDGKAVAKALGIRPGPSVGVHLQKVMDFQLEYPTKTQQECVEWLVETVKKESEGE